MLADRSEDNCRACAFHAVIIGIGADDLFVFLDIWKLAKPFAVEPRERLARTLSHTGSALLTTTLTTAISFFTLALGPLPTVAALGILTGIGTCSATITAQLLAVTPCDA